MKNTKGISDVVSTVLIILLVVAAVAILGAIIMNVVNRGGTEVSGTVACQTLQLKPISCKLNTGNYVGVAQLANLPTDTSLSAVNFLYVMTDGRTLPGTMTGTLPTTAGQTVDGSISQGTTGNNPKFRVSAKLSFSDGKTATCDAKPGEEIPCT